MKRDGAAALLRKELGREEDRRFGRLYGKRRSLKAATVSLVLLACLAAASVMAWNVANSRRLELANAGINASNTALTLANQASSSFNVADTVLVSLVDKIETEGWSELNVDRLRTLMAKQMDHLPALQGLFVYDETGRWIANSSGRKFDGRNNGDRAYFRYHKGSRDRGVHIGSPIIGRTSGAWVLPVSRRIEHPDGSFAGVALATIKIDFYRRIYESLDLGPGGQVLMTLNDGTLLLREPFDQRELGRSIASSPEFLLQAQQAFATRTIDTELEGEALIFSHARIGSYPVGITVVKSQDTILDAWRNSAVFACLAMLVLIAGLLLLGRRVVRQVALRDQLERELLSTKAGLETANAALSTMAYIDGLTELFNRRYYEQALQREIGRASRNRAPIAVLMLDVDFFKKYNDRYGHQAGDATLKAVAQAIQRGLRRSGDLAARYGGEEFVVILPDTDLAGAREVAETIRSAVQARALAHQDAPGGVITVSIGIHAAVPEGGADGAELVARADAALYRAKEAGRNRSAS
ncbi:MAG: diguanylate cyclase [Janthinobacterium lividum]